MEERNGLKIACLEEIAFRFGWIVIEELKSQIPLNSEYGKYLKNLLLEDPYSEPENF